MAIRKLILSEVFDREKNNKKDPYELCSSILNKLKKFAVDQETEFGKSLLRINQRLEELLDNLEGLKIEDRVSRFDQVRKRIVLDAIKFPEYAIVEREILALLIKYYPKIFLLQLSRWYRRRHNKKL